jgi:uncharacterized protein (TIGR02145 family)
MKHILTIVLLIAFDTLCAQTSVPDTLTDVRDNKKYRIQTINNTTWMLDNLDYEADHSVGLTEEQRKEYNKLSLYGRYYHFETIDSACPAGWRLPSIEDWDDYYSYLLNLNRRKKASLEVVELKDEEEGHRYVSFLNYKKRIDLFAKDNPLNLQANGRVEGNRFTPSSSWADYFAADSKETYKGKSHIHIMQEWTTIHSHEHNMQPEKEDELRKFMVRCVKE